MNIVISPHPPIQVLKNLESSLHHYNTCLQLYNPSRYPRRWGIGALEMGMALGAMADLVERVSQTVFVADRDGCELRRQSLTVCRIDQS